MLTVMQDLFSLDASQDEEKTSASRPKLVSQPKAAPLTEQSNKNYNETVPRSQLTKGKVVPPSVTSLAGPSYTLPEVLSTSNRPVAVFPGVHVVDSVQGTSCLNLLWLNLTVTCIGGPEPNEEPASHRTRKLNEEQSDRLHRRFLSALRSIVCHDLHRRIVRTLLRVRIQLMTCSFCADERLVVLDQDSN